MKKSLADFASSKPQKPPETLRPKPSTPPNPQNQIAQENLEKQIKHFESMPREDLLKTLHEEVAKQKQNGTFDIQKLENTLSSLDAFLTPQQKKNIKELLNQIQ